MTCRKVTLVNMADKENKDPDTPVAKKRRPSLLLSKKGKAVPGEDNFKFDMSNSEFKEMCKGFCPKKYKVGIVKF